MLSSGFGIRFFTWRTWNLNSRKIVDHLEFLHICDFHSRIVTDSYDFSLALRCLWLRIVKNMCLRTAGCHNFAGFSWMLFSDHCLRNALLGTFALRLGKFYSSLLSQNDHPLLTAHTAFSPLCKAYITHCVFKTGSRSFPSVNNNRIFDVAVMQSSEEKCLLVSTASDVEKVSKYSAFWCNKYLFLLRWVWSLLWSDCQIGSIDRAYSSIIDWLSVAC